VEVAITDIKLAPIAYFISIPNKIVRAGVIIVPPPRPNMDPTMPASIDIIKICNIKSDNISSPMLNKFYFSSIIITRNMYLVYLKT